IALKHDRKNYNALLLFGRASQELGKMEDCKKALLMATQVEPENSVAWQGLVQLYEKSSQVATLQEVNAVCTRLVQLLQGDDDKTNSVYRRLAAVQLDRDDKLSAADTLTTLARRLHHEPRQSVDVWQSVAQILSPLPDLADGYVSMLQEALENSLSESVLGENERNYQTYIKLLYRTRQKGRSGVANAALNMANIFTTSYPLEWVCRMYVEMSSRPIEGEDEFPLSEDEVCQQVSRLLRLNNVSVWGNLAQGLLCRKEGKLLQARAHLRLGAERGSPNLLGWRLLLESQASGGDWPGVEVSCRRSLDVMAANPTATVPDDDRDADGYRVYLRLMQARALVNMGHRNHLRQAVDILQEHVGSSLECGVQMVSSRIKLTEFDQAEADLEKLESIFGEEMELKLMTASLLAARGERNKAKLRLQELVKEYPSCAEGHLELAILYYQISEYNKAQLSCMRAAKLNPHLAHPFLYLGHYYRREDNMDRALKCYEKALALAPSDNQVGAALSDLYRVLGKHEANLQLLERVTREGGRSGGGWAWLRLGLHHLATHQPQEATYALQCALTITPDDSAVYECLGDAYVARGAYAAALKAYTCASQLNPAALYPLYRIAHIQQLTSELLEATSGYEAVLKREPGREVCVVALVGLAEAQLAAARRAADQAMFSNVKEACTAALTALTRAGSMQPESACIWKLVGDGCTLLYQVPPSLTPLHIPARLVNKEATDLNQQTSITKLEVLQLGARCYGLGLQLNESDAGLWHDLATNMYQQARLQEHTTIHEKQQQQQVESKDEVAKELLQRALMALRKSLNLDPSSGQTWTTLGIITAHKLIDDQALAQHCLIRACESQPCASTWTHLGAYYLSHGDADLAHEAFSQAQAHDPAYVGCWVGQALVAESIGHHDTFDLFRHTTLLGVHPESCIGYAHHVANLACDPKRHTDKHTQLAIRQSLPTATDCAVIYAREHECDPIGQNLAGLFLEMSGLKQSSITRYRSALTTATHEKSSIEGLEDGVRTNLGRILTSSGLVEEAVKHLAAIKSPDFFTQCTLALASLKVGEFEDAYNGYTAALHWLAPDDGHKSHVLVALATLQYKFTNTDEAKELLIQGSQVTDASVQGVLALGALGLMVDDEALSAAALAKLLPHLHDTRYTHHIAFLRAAHATLAGRESEGRLSLSQTIHQHPSIAGLRRSLANLLLAPSSSAAPTPPLVSAARCSASATCAAAAAKLTQTAGHTNTLAQDSVTSVMARLGMEAVGGGGGHRHRRTMMGSSSSSSSSSGSSGMKEAQRSVLMSPGSPEAWAALVAARLAAGHSKSKVGELAGVWAEKASPVVSSWLQSVSGREAQLP
ncbi:hypothetical protein Pmani_037531, partial [Petrolisthes manimaculis]